MPERDGLAVRHVRDLRHHAEEQGRRLHSQLCRHRQAGTLRWRVRMRGPRSNRSWKASGLRGSPANHLQSRATSKPRAPPSRSPQRVRFPTTPRAPLLALLGDGRGWGFATAAGLETGRARPIYTVFRACVRRGAAAARVGGSCAPPESASVWGSSAGHIGATRRRVSASTRRSNGARSFCSELFNIVSAIIRERLILLDHLPRQRDRLAPNSRKSATFFAISPLSPEPLRVKSFAEVRLPLSCYLRALPPQM